VTILGTGGTIASRVDYRTGAVKPAVSSEELAEILPELRELAFIEPEVILNKYSEHITPSDWTTMAQITADKIESGVSGVVILHGTDTLGYTAAALSFALRELPVPVVVVGSQRSSDRPSSDAALNLISAVAVAARAPFAEVTVAMHENLSDDFVLLHRATRVRKNHTSRRDAFQTIDSTPLGRVKGGSELELLTDDYLGRDPARELRLRGRFNEKVALLKFYPSFDPSLIDFLVDKGYLGFVLEGSGLGHINDRSYRSRPISPVRSWREAWVGHRGASGIEIETRLWRDRSQSGGGDSPSVVNGEEAVLPLSHSSGREGDRQVH